MTPITSTTLKNAGYHLIHRGNVSYYKKNNLRVIYVKTDWYICDVNGNIGNAYYRYMEELEYEMRKIL